MPEMKKIELGVQFNDCLRILKKKLGSLVLFTFTSFFLPVGLLLGGAAAIFLSSYSGVESMLDSMAEGSFDSMKSVMIWLYIGMGAMMLVLVAFQAVHTSGTALIVRSYYDDRKVAQKNIWRYALRRMGAVIASILPLCLAAAALMVVALFWMFHMMESFYTGGEVFQMLSGMLLVWGLELVVVAVSLLLIFVPYAAAHRGTFFGRSLRINFRILFYNHFWLKSIGYQIIFSLVLSAVFMILEIILTIISIPFIILSVNNFGFLMAWFFIMYAVMLSCALVFSSAWMHAEYIHMEREAALAGRLEGLVHFPAAEQPADNAGETIEH